MECRILGAIAALLLLVPGAPGLAGELTASLDFRTGDRFQLSLRTETTTSGLARSGEPHVFDEAVRLEYDATVLVLETSESGRPVRERHEDVALAVTRPDGSSSVFGGNATLEVRWADRGIEIFSGDERAPEAFEDIVGEMLTQRFDRAAFAAWLEPPPSVAVGDRWELDADQTRRMLAERGLRAAGFEAPPTATLERHGESRVIHYRIPVQRFAIDELPQRTRVARSQAVLEGRLGLPGPATAGAFVHSSSLTLDMSGSVAGSAPTVTWSFDREAKRSDAPSQHWRLGRSSSVDQRIVPIEQVARTR